jgi:hypothetical protein
MLCDSEILVCRALGSDRFSLYYFCTPSYIVIFFVIASTSGYTFY